MESSLILSILACIVLGYFLGCISPAYIIGCIKGYDVRKSGSKNAGASNTVIMAGKKAGIFVALVDIFKAWAAWRMAQYMFPKVVLGGLISGSACVIGHMFPVFLRFRGGKGFACLGGMALAHSPWSFLCLFTMALFLAIMVKYVAVVASVMSLVFPLWYYITGGALLGALILAVPAGPMVYKHRENFRRIKEGSELRISYLWNRSAELERTGYNQE